jgi:hypothetical protein
MALVIEDDQVEKLAQQIASAQGIPVLDVLRQSLSTLAGLHRLPAHNKTPLRERLAALATEVDAIPARTPANPQNDNEILNYNEIGVWS